jgi:hypothetical protein
MNALRKEKKDVKRLRIKAVPLETQTVREGSKRIRLPDFRTIRT